MEKWKHFTEIDFQNKEFNLFNIDTRDFHVSCQNDENSNLRVILNKPSDDFIYSHSELIDLINRLYEESGGKKKWRMLSLDSSSESTKNWNLKYLRVVKNEKGFIICNSYYKAISKNNLSAKVNQELLGAY